MGGTDLPKPPSLVTSAALAAMIARGATSPNAQHSTIRDGALQVTDPNAATRVASGSYTFSRGPNLGKTIYAHITFDANGNPVVIQGQQPNGKHGIGVYDQLGNLVTFIGAQGITSYDPGGNPRSTLGALINGDFGLAVYDRSNSGVYQEVLPMTAQTVNTLISISSATYIQSGGPVVTATVGASGKAYVLGSAAIATSAASVAGFAGLYIDGVFYSDWVILGSGASSGIQGNVATGLVISSLTVGSHTFELWYRSTIGGTTVTFTGRNLVVQPL